VLGFDGIVLAPSGLPLRRLPAAELSQAFRILAVTLVPTPWLVPAPTPLAQADPSPRSSRPGRTAALCRTLTVFHGSANSQGTARGESILLLGHLITTGQRNGCSPVYTSK
jgi:hypothetical protein